MKAIQIKKEVERVFSAPHFRIHSNKILGWGNGRYILSIHDLRGKLGCGFLLFPNQVNRKMIAKVLIKLEEYHESGV